MKKGNKEKKEQKEEKMFVSWDSLIINFILYPLSVESVLVYLNTFVTPVL